MFLKAPGAAKSFTARCFELMRAPAASPKEGFEPFMTSLRTRISLPRYAVVLHVEKSRLDLVRAVRSWRSWESDPPESLRFAGEEGVIDALQRLNLRNLKKATTALVVIVSRPYYSFHREFYPPGLEERLKDVLEFEWEENLLLEEERSLYFAGLPVPTQAGLMVPVYSMTRDFYDKFYQLLGAQDYFSFTMVPDAVLQPWPVNGLRREADETEGSESRLIGRRADSRQLAVFVVRNELCEDSFLVKPCGPSLQSFTHRLAFREEAQTAESFPGVTVVFQPDESFDEVPDEWEATGLPLERKVLPEPLVAHWTRRLLELQAPGGFGDTLRLKPWRIPKSVAVAVAAVFFYGVFALFQVHSHEAARERYETARRERAQLEAQWRPIEELQERISKLKEGQASLEAFDASGHSVLELLTFLTEVTPEGTWLNYLVLKEDELRLRGESESAVRYLAELAKVQGFSDVSLVSPISTDPRSGKERFYLKVRLERERVRTLLEEIDVGTFTTDGESLGVNEAEPLPEVPGSELPGPVEEPVKDQET